MDIPAIDRHDDHLFARSGNVPPGKDEFAQREPTDSVDRLNFAEE
jgi:hypothetical protein